MGADAKRRIENGGVELELAVEFGGKEYAVDWQYVSNQAFEDSEIHNWWRMEEARGISFLSEAEYKTKLADLL